MTGVRLSQPNVKLVCGILLLMLVGLVPQLSKNSQAAVSNRQALTFEDRVAAQRAIEMVYWRHRIWSKDNLQPKPTLDEVLPETILRAKVEEYLRQSSALEIYWQHKITAAELQAELERMANHTHQPEILRELWTALGNDPLIVAECLGRQLLAERELRVLGEECGMKAEELQRIVDTLPVISPNRSKESAEGFAFQLPKLGVAAAPCGTEAWTAISTTGAPTARAGHLAVWTGSEMIIWGGQGPDGYDNVGGRYSPATDSWMAMTLTGAPSPRQQDFTGIWTGIELIIWGGYYEPNTLNSGGRYNPTTNTWASTTLSNAPSARGYHSAVWAGTEMIVWGGISNYSSDGVLLNSGGKYNPKNDTWTTISMVGSPTARINFSAVWIGNEMMVWGGVDSSSMGRGLSTGGRYNPLTDSWKVVNPIAPEGRRNHIAVWTGVEVIVWGGTSPTQSPRNTCSRYDPINNTWDVSGRNGVVPPLGITYVAFWTGNEMLVWTNGGTNEPVPINTGGKYNPTKDSWTIIPSAPDEKSNASVVWTGTELIVWGGFGRNSFGNIDRTRTGMRYGLIPQASISSTSQSFFAAGGVGSVNVTAQGGCNWVAQSNAAWLTITSGSTGAGNGSVNFSVASNSTGIERTGTLTIGGQTFTVTQSNANPVAALAGLTPNTILAGSNSFTLTVNGTGFVTGALVRWNGNNRPTTVVSSSQLTAQIPASDALTLGTVNVTVLNPAPSGGVSNSLSFTVSPSLANVSAASFSAATVAPESMIAAFGAGLSTQTLSAPTVPLPTTLAGTTLRVRDSAGVERFAPLFFVAPAQINYLVPAGTAAGAGVVTVTSGNGKLSIGAVQVAAIAPALFTANANGQGVPAAVALRVRGVAQSFEPVARLDAATNRFIPLPIDLGADNEQVILLLFGTGIRGRTSWATVPCQIGGVNVPVLFAAAQGDLAGLDQINVGALPRSLVGRGEMDLVLMVDGKAANTVRVAIK